MGKVVVVVGQKGETEEEGAEDDTRRPASLPECMHECVGHIKLKAFSSNFRHRVRRGPSMGATARLHHFLRNGRSCRPLPFAVLRFRWRVCLVNMPHTT